MLLIDQSHPITMTYLLVLSAVGCGFNDWTMKTYGTFSNFNQIITLNQEQQSKKVAVWPRNIWRTWWFSLIFEGNCWDKIDDNKCNKWPEDVEGYWWLPPWWQMEKSWVSPWTTMKNVVGSWLVVGWKVVQCYRYYPLVIPHNHGKSSLLIGTSSINGSL